MSEAALYPLGLRIEGGRHRRLREQVEGGDIVVAPGAFDCLTARLVQAAGFPALYVTGAGISISGLGAPDVGVMSFGEILDRVRRIADSVAIPLIADADTGYGGPLNVIRTVREFERAGVSAVQIEDQAWPKKCGHEPGRRVAPVEEMVGRIKAAVDARVDPDVMIVARTDARSQHGLEAALERAARMLRPARTSSSWSRRRPRTSSGASPRPPPSRPLLTWWRGAGRRSCRLRSSLSSASVS